MMGKQLLLPRIITFLYNICWHKQQLKYFETWYCCYCKIWASVDNFFSSWMNPQVLTWPRSRGSLWRGATGNWKVSYRNTDVFSHKGDANTWNGPPTEPKTTMLSTFENETERIFKYQISISISMIGGVRYVNVYMYMCIYAICVCVCMCMPASLTAVFISSTT